MQEPLILTTCDMRSFLPQAQTRGTTAVPPTTQAMTEKARAVFHFASTLAGSTEQFFQMPRE